ncbi:MAG TPA: carboxypeptidase-like regulatory domain-containing protein, partial [Vicinamibacterales bacterium]|nr:carboxypeptidase-like regulatory domain-containing protein [Vicinamibacterales bacterium]
MFSVLLALALSWTAAQAQQRLVVVDQTGLPLPGAHVDVRRGDQIVASLDTGQDGGFALPELQADDVIEISLDGFETAKVPASSHGDRVILALARATETTEVVASALTSTGASMQHLGSTMTAPLAQRLPTARPRILQSLPLLPAVVRGRDGQLRIGGTRPHESSLW